MSNTLRGKKTHGDLAPTLLSERVGSEKEQQRRIWKDAMKNKYQEYLAKKLERDTEKITSELKYLFEEFLGGFGDEDIEKPIMKRIWALRAEHGSDTVMQAVQTMLRPDDCLELFVLARAGIASVTPALYQYLEREEHDCRYWAALGLAHLDEDEGFKALLEYAHNPESELLDPVSEILEELNRIKSLKARYYINQLNEFASERFKHRGIIDERMIEEHTAPGKKIQE